LFVFIPACVVVGLEEEIGLDMRLIGLQGVWMLCSMATETSDEGMGRAQRPGILHM
jgi:hypothetical protein